MQSLSLLERERRPYPPSKHPNARFHDFYVKAKVPVFRGIRSVRSFAAPLPHHTKNLALAVCCVAIQVCGEGGVIAWAGGRRREGQGGGQREGEREASAAQRVVA